MSTKKDTDTTSDAKDATTSEAKSTTTAKSVTLTAPSGTKVTVSADAAKRLKARGYKG